MQKLFAAFGHSLNGLRWGMQYERAIRQEIWMLALSLPVGALIADNLLMFVMLVGAVLLVLAVELLNTGLEKLCDYVMPDHHPDIGRIKDMGSAAVLASLVLAGLVWLVGLWDWLSR